MTIHITGMIWARPTSDLEPLSGEAFQPDFIESITRVHEEGGFDRVLAGYWTDAADGHLVLAHAAAVAGRINFLLAHRPGFVAPTLEARKLATLDHLTGGRLALHVISGGEDADQRKDGDFADHDARYRRTDEFLEILRRSWRETAPFDHDGAFYRVEKAWSSIRPLQKPGLPIFFGGASDAALRVAARHADVYALFGEPLADTKAVLARLRAAAGRELAFSWSNRPIIGATEKQAWERAHDIRARAIAKQQAVGTAGLIAAGQAVNSQRLVGLSQRGEVLDERLWTAMAGVLGGRGNSTALVGTAEQVARSMLRYRRELGVSHFIIRGWDPLEDAVTYGRELIPLLRELADDDDVERRLVSLHTAAA
jgi:alkanesulfonate monooxygenase